MPQMPATCLGWVLAAALGGFNSGGSTSTIGPDAGPLPPLLAILVTLLAVLFIKEVPLRTSVKREDELMAEASQA